MFSYNDSIAILSEKILPQLATVIAKEGLQVTTQEMKDTKVVAKLAQLFESAEEFTLSIYSETNHNFLMAEITKDIYRAKNGGRAFVIYFANDSHINTSEIVSNTNLYGTITIPCGLPLYLHKFVLAVIAEWL